LHAASAKGEGLGEMIAFLISDAAGLITGQNFVVDGGMTRKMIHV
jgi:NAD(P)-dependent dehydrogenase (short-subunit alcohol dehydrogenase family)